VVNVATRVRRFGLLGPGRAVVESRDLRRKALDGLADGEVQLFGDAREVPQGARAPGQQRLFEPLEAPVRRRAQLGEVRGLRPVGE